MRVTVRHGGEDRDLTIRGLTPGATLADVTGAVLPAAATVFVDGVETDPGQRINDSLRDGSVIETVGPASGAAPEPVAVLHAVAGDASGRSWILAAGRYQVGRSGSIALDGPPAALEVAPDGSATWNGARFPAGSIGHGPARLRLGPPTPSSASHTPGTRSFFNRPPRHLEPETPAIFDPPTRRPLSGSPRRISAIMLVIPLVTGVGMALLFGRVLFLAFALLGPIGMIGSTIDDRRRRRKDSRDCEEDFARDLGRFAKTLEQAAQAEAIRSHRQNAAVSELLVDLAARSPAMWERRPGHRDHLRVVLGYGSVPWIPGLSGPATEPEVRAAVESVTLPPAPITAEFTARTVLGVSGERSRSQRLAADILCQLAARQGPADLRVAVLSDDPAAWEWVKWLPHVASNLLSEARLLASSTDEIAALLAALRTPVETEWPVIVLVVDHRALDDDQRRVVRELLAGVGRPCSGIVLVGGPEDLPAASTEVITIRGHRTRFTRPHSGVTIEDVTPGGIDRQVAVEVARTIAPFDDPEAAVAGAGLPDFVRLVDLLGFDEIDAEAILHRWDEAARTPSIQTPIGMSEAGPYVVDLVRDGPHALMAGTTGSGKSEFLRSLVAGLAATVTPEYLTFVLVDYKGGAAFDACASLPHVVGLVTDLDEHLGQRALLSLEAELHHREERLRAAGVSDIAELWASHPPEPMPRVAVIVDEFATLANELPDFMNALVDIAQRGRSLGVHMVLATQRPSGVIKDPIRANINLRISLRVQSVADSKDVLNTPEAAALPRSKPGRGYARLGPGELVPFQAALATVGARTSAAEIQVTPFTFSMRQPPPPMPLSVSGPSDLQRLVDATIEAAERRHIATPRRPWTVPLPARLAVASLPAPAVAGEAVVGLVDQPTRQRQVPWSWRPHDDGNLLLVGRQGWGPTEAMMALATSLCSSADPDDLHIYAIDHGSGRLATLDALPHVGSVLAADDLDRQKRLLRRLRDQCERRRRRPGGPTTVLLIDGLAGFKAAFGDMDVSHYRDMLLEIASAGPQLGVFVVVTADQNRAIPPSLAGAMARRLAFSLSDRLEYGMIGVHGSVPDLPRGRAIDPVTQEHVQTATVETADISAVASAASLAAQPPEPVRSLPPVVTVSEIVDAGETQEDHWILPLGLDDESLAAATVRLFPGEHLLISGPGRSGRSTALAALAAVTRKLSRDATITVVCPRPSALRLHPALDTVLRSLDGLETENRAEHRHLLLIDDAEEVLDDGGLLSEVIETRRAGITIVAAGRTDALRGAHRHWTRGLRAARRGVILRPFDSGDGDVLGVRLPRSATLFDQPGRGYLVDGGTVALVQLAKD